MMLIICDKRDMKVVQQMQERNALKEELLMEMEYEEEWLETSGRTVFLVFGTSRASRFCQQISEELVLAGIYANNNQIFLSII